jgi:hypothetical protein
MRSTDDEAVIALAEASAGEDLPALVRFRRTFGLLKLIPVRNHGYHGPFPG